MKTERILVHVPLLSPKSTAMIGDRPEVDNAEDHRNYRNDPATRGGPAHLDGGHRRLGDTTRPLPGDSPDTSRSVGSTGSFLSVRSLGSIGSALSIGSAGSVLSVGSAGSILSIGSAGSILSIGSAGSILSIGSTGSIGAIGGRDDRDIPARFAQPAATALGLFVMAMAVVGARR